MRMGYEQSRLNWAVERLAKLIELRERVLYEQPRTYLDVSIPSTMAGVDIQVTAPIRRTKLLELISAEEHDAAELALRLLRTD